MVVFIATVAIACVVSWLFGAIVGFWSGVRRTWAKVNQICDESGFAALVRKVDRDKAGGE